MKSSPLPDSTSAWDQYWRDGRLASCGGEGGANYQPLIAEGWRIFFDALFDGAHVLDICTGNGAVARLAAETASMRNRRLTIEAVDSATIHPIGLGPCAGMIRFSPRTPAENLPFPDASFDAIVGQYALEYTDAERTLAELKRVSRPTASVRFVTHAAGSVVVLEAERQLADVERLTATGVFEAAETFARAAANPAAVPVPEAARTNFENALRSLQEATQHALDLRMYNNASGVIVHAIQQQPRVGAGPVLAKIDEIASAIKAHQGRLSAMRRAALDESGARALSARAEELWSRRFGLEPLVRPDGAMFGWVLATAPETGAGGHR